MDSFSTLQLPVSIGDAIARIGFKVPTPIQSKAIPVALSGQDLIGCAQTGTGKTAAYCIPIFSRLLQFPNDLAVVLVPTRELARQIEEFWRQLASGQQHMTCTSLIGGVPMHPQIRSLSRNPRLVIATPGRLIDHLNRRTINLSRTSILVLDEADRMLDMGFEPQLARIAKFVPQRRQTLLFSATLSSEAERLSAKFVKNAIRVTIGEVSQACDRINQNFLSTESSLKNQSLLDEINRRQKETILVFARTQSRTDRVARYLSSYGLEVARLHGGRTQGQRNAALNAFKTGKVRILVATDIASRGIDVTGVESVINYDLPQLAEDYIHRIGRTGRAGACGEAVSLITHEDRPLWRQILNLLRKTGSNIPVSRDSAGKGMTSGQTQPLDTSKTQPKARETTIAKEEMRKPAPPKESAGKSRPPFRQWKRSRPRRNYSRPSA